MEEIKQINAANSTDQKHPSTPNSVETRGPRKKTAHEPNLLILPQIANRKDLFESVATQVDTKLLQNAPIDSAPIPNNMYPSTIPPVQLQCKLKKSTTCPISINEAINCITFPGPRIFLKILAQNNGKRVFGSAYPIDNLPTKVL